MNTSAPARQTGMTTMIDLGPAAQRMADLIAKVPADALDGPTPCSDYSLGDLLDHIAGVPLAFTGAARKKPLPPAPPGDAARLHPDWRTRIPADLATLAEAWKDPSAWDGMTAAGGVDLPGDVAALVALDELVLHAWDLAVSIGEPADYDGPGLDAVHATVKQFREADVPDLFGPEVPVQDDAPLFKRVLGLAGRDPGWSPPA